MIKHSKKVNNDSNLNMEGVVVYSCLGSGQMLVAGCLWHPANSMFASRGV
jgi:hypothetical protein